MAGAGRAPLKGYNNPPLTVAALPASDGHFFAEPGLVTTPNGLTPLRAVVRERDLISLAAFEAVLVKNNSDTIDAPGAVAAMMASMVTAVSVRVALEQSSEAGRKGVPFQAETGGKAFLDEVRRLADVSEPLELRSLVDESVMAAAIHLKIRGAGKKFNAGLKPPPEKAKTAKNLKNAAGSAEGFRASRISLSPLLRLGASVQLDDGVAYGRDADRTIPAVRALEIAYEENPAFVGRATEVALGLLSDSITRTLHSMQRASPDEPRLFVSAESKEAGFVPLLGAADHELGLALESSGRAESLRAATGLSAALPMPTSEGSVSSAALRANARGVGASWNKSTTGLGMMRPRGLAGKQVVTAGGEVSTLASPPLGGIELICEGIPNVTDFPRASARLAGLCSEDFGPKRYRYSGDSPILPEDTDSLAASTITAMIISTLAAVTTDEAALEVARLVDTNSAAPLPPRGTNALKQAGDFSWARTVLSTGTFFKKFFTVREEAGVRQDVVTEPTVNWSLITMDLPVSAEEVVFEILLYLYAAFEMRRAQIMIPESFLTPAAAAATEALLNARAMKVRAILTASGGSNSWRRSIVVTVTRLFYRITLRERGKSITKEEGVLQSAEVLDELLEKTTERSVSKLVSAFRGPVRPRPAAEPEASSSPLYTQRPPRPYGVLASTAAVFFEKRCAGHIPGDTMYSFVRVEALAAMVRLLYRSSPGRIGPPYGFAAFQQAQRALRTIASKRSGVLMRLFPYLAAIVCTANYAQVVKADLSVDAPDGSQLPPRASRRTEVAVFTPKAAQSINTSSITARAQLRSGTSTAQRYGIGTRLANKAVTVRLSPNDHEAPTLLVWNIPLQRRASFWSLHPIDTWGELRKLPIARVSATATTPGFRIDTASGAQLVSVKLKVSLRRPPQATPAVPKPEAREIRFVLTDHFADNGSSTAFVSEVFFRLLVDPAAAAMGWAAEVAVESITEVDIL